MTERAYLLPDNLLPEDNFCAKVYIPNSDEYRRAFLGAYFYFGKWVAWERDDAHSAAIAASRWRDAIDLTMETWGDGCACDEMTEDEILDLINGVIDDMTINNCITVNCGCGCSGTSSTGSIPDGVSENINPLPNDWNQPPDMEVVQPTDKQCAIAHYILMNWRNTILAIANGDVSPSGLLGYLNSLFTEVLDWLQDAASMVMAIIGAYNVFPNNASVLSTEIDRIYNDMQCRILTGGSEQAVMDDLYALIDSTSLSFYNRYYMKMILSYVPVTAVHVQSVVDGVTVPAEYYNRGCPACVSSLPPAPVTSGLFLRDWTGTSGKLYVDGVIVGTSGMEFDFYKTYQIAGDTAGHMDAQISSEGNADTPAVCSVAVTNPNAYSITLECMDAALAPFSQIIGTSETVVVETSRLDLQYGSFANDHLSIVISPLSGA